MTNIHSNGVLYIVNIELKQCNGAHYIVNITLNRLKNFILHILNIELTRH